MPWNEPGNKNSDNKDPWGGGSKSGGNSSFDLERWLRQWMERLGGRRRPSSGGDGSGSGFPSVGIGVVLVVVVVGWLASGFYVVGAGERGVVLRFGAFASQSQPGPHWHLPYPFESVKVVDVSRVRSTQSKSVLLTQDNNIVHVDISAQYRVSDARQYLFDLSHPDQTLRDVMISAVREVVGQNKMDYVVGQGRSDIANRVQQIMQKVLDGYQAGLDVSKVTVVDAQPPSQVQSAFADAIKAHEDKTRFRNEAEAYANTAIAQARAKASHLIEQAQAYKEQVVARAQGDTARFDEMLKEYLKAPKVTRERLYLETMQTVLSNSSKVLIDTGGKGGKNLFYLPLNNLMSGSSPAPSGGSGPAAGNGAAAAPGAAGADPMQAERLRRDARLRGGR